MACFRQCSFKKKEIVKNIKMFYEYIRIRNLRYEKYNHDFKANPYVSVFNP